MGDREAMRLYSRIHNFPNKMQNLCGKIIALRDEAGDLGYAKEHALLSRLADIAKCKDATVRPLVWKRWSNLELYQLEQMLAQGETYAEIGRALGKSRNAVSSAVKRHNLRK